LSAYKGVTEENSYQVAWSRGIEFHDGGVHRNLRCMPERIVVDEEFRGE
jgi:hypothetical protein